MGLLLKRPALLLLTGVLLALASVGLALLTQHVGGMLPCAWCVLQRLIFLAFAAVALVGLLWHTRWGRRLSALLALALAGSGVAAAAWQHWVAAKSDSCVQTLADRIVGALGLDRALPDVFAAYASCADAKVNLMGVPYEFYSMAVFAVLALLALPVIRTPLSRH